WLSLTERPSWLRLRGRQSMFSLFEQSLLARRVQSLKCTAETCVEFNPTHFTQMAGLICYYDTKTFYYLRITHDEQAGKRLGIALCDDGSYNEPADAQLPINDWPRAYLRAEFDRERLHFYASADGKSWQMICPVQDATRLSDDYGTGLHFTGAMVGVCAQDLGGTGATADFDYFTLTNAEG
ncbi:MAG TPA: DUF1349 domain-containing protein, partial [Tepidisphaeraceae bacterium]|nr:DUF1349 domain-containing protein [Tepidisphaeraceae bacterium]